ncbi:hypothetical protein [Lysobacter sp. CA196]|uniref:hypothetical protein n=1 Tax=Lysobacter sp. CA196 TaxID=3455606 RepID=UPI003F8D06AD
MSSFNPYEAPKSALVHPGRNAGEQAGEQAGPWRDGKDLVAQRNSELPARCVKCNADAKTPKLFQRYYWHHRGWHLLILFNLVIYVIVRVAIRKSARLNVGVCADHARQRLVAMWAVALLLVASVATLLVAMNERLGAVAYLSSLALLIAATAVGLLKARLLYPKRIGERYARFAGCGDEFLATLPSFGDSER